MKPYLIHKEDPRLPDSYGMEVLFHGDLKPVVFDLVEHKLLDKVYEPVFDASGNPVFYPNGIQVFKCVGPSPVPIIQYVTRDNIHGNFPVSSYKELRLDDRYSKILELKREIEEKKKNDEAKKA